VPAPVRARVPLDRDVHRRGGAAARGYIDADSDAAGRGAAAVVERGRRLTGSRVGDGDDHAADGGGDEHGGGKGEQTAGH